MSLSRSRCAGLAPLVSILALALPACSGAGATAASSPAVATGSSHPAAAAGWSGDALAGIPTTTQGAIGYVVLSDGTVVAALSYASDSEPFLIYRGKSGQLARAVAPWACSAGPAEIDAVGPDLWVHCVDPEAPEEQPRNHFWHSNDAGRTWTRIGAIDGMIVMGQHAEGGGALFVSGSFERKEAALQVVRRGNDGHFGATAAAGSLDWPKDTRVAMAAAADGSSVAILGEISGGKGGDMLALALSTDGGKTLREVARVPRRQKLGLAPPTLVNGTVTVLAEDSGGHLAGVLVWPTGAAEPRLQALARTAEDACVHGAHVAARFGKGDWGTSVDHGATFTVIPAPESAAATDFPPPLSCSGDGVRSGAQLMAWPTR